MTNASPPSQTPPNDQFPEWSFDFAAFGESLAQLLTQLGIGNDADLQSANLSEPLGESTRAKIRLDFTVGYAVITALPLDSPNLIEARLTSIGAVEMQVSTEADGKSVWVRQKRSSAEDPFKTVKDAVDTVAHNPVLRWEIALSQRIPLTLEVNGGFTLNHFDLSLLNVPRLRVYCGAGQSTLQLPAIVVNAVVEGGVGITDIHITNGAKVTLHLDAGAGAATLHVGQADLKAEIDGGIGNLIVNIPVSIALRVQGDSGLGNIIVPERAISTVFESEFISESGIWETPNFAQASPRIEVRYEGGVGSLIVQELVPEVVQPQEEPEA
ncbi:MAG: hypothetical protein ACOYL5_02010 [Phototrophicaceae bacterium]